MSNQVRRRSWWVYVLFFLFTQLIAGVIVVALSRFDLGILMSNQNTLAPAMLIGNLLGILLFFCFRPQSITWSSTLAGVKGRKGRRSLLIFLLALPVIMLVNLTQEVGQVITQVIEQKSSVGGLKNVVWVAAGGSNGGNYPAQYFMEHEATALMSHSYTSNEFVRITPKFVGENTLAVVVESAVLFKKLLFI